MSSVSAKKLNSPVDYLKKYFGYDQFRPLQAEIIDNVIHKKDALVLMPTGGGKSICYQIPALMLPGTALVISPLISLMQDQVASLKASGVQAEFINSSLDFREEQHILDRCREGDIDLLYLSPEKLQSKLDFILDHIKIGLLAIDEAHCISQWGHDFRPEYTQLAHVKKKLPNVPVIALTATADKITRSDVLQQLDIEKAQTFISSFDRPNLSLSVRQNISKRNKQKEILEFIQSRPNASGIVYCLSRKNTEEISAYLNLHGIKSAYYHAGMESKERHEVQEAFIKDETPVICATIAFGMGIDKPNVRWVIHYNLPKSIENYFQEIGRAGRDGLPSDTFLYYNLGDLVMLRKFAEESGQRDINVDKLYRMQEYAEAVVCRRKILLSYFGESLEENCGNCDVCENPPKFFDGTIIAQKAMSAIKRTEEKCGIMMLIDILRGSQKKHLFQKGYHEIKTFGMGSDISHDDWLLYIMQLIQQGLVEIAYNEGKSLKVTEYGAKVLYGKAKIALVDPKIIEARKPLDKKTEKERKEKALSNELFQLLRQERQRIAKLEAVPPYVVFNDATLQEMARDMPLTKDDFALLQGVGAHKLERYADAFLEVIRSYKFEKGGKKRKGDTQIATLQLYKQGLTPEEIATRRNLHIVTIYSHLSYLYQKGENINIEQYLRPQAKEEIFAVLPQFDDYKTLKPIHEALEEKYEYYEIRLAVALYEG
ncbi:MAG TPA: DNA helicase RecQ [Cytophagales bacterium]|jgi:ATP-dependent DNA helicase RecQ|nr:DNA helicase RecQ [Cytophagales bacterium]